MAKRRHNGEGTITQRPGGTWQARLSYVDPVTGQRKRVSVDGPTAAAVRAKMKEARERLEAGAPPRDAADTVADWLKQWCATTLAVSDRKESTKASYQQMSRKHLSANCAIGTITLDKLRPSDVEQLILDLRSAGYSDSTVRVVYQVLRMALDGAVRDGLIGRNPAASVAWPGVKRTEARYLDSDGVTAILEAAQTSRYYLALLLISSTGLRRGEALALSWDHADLDAGVLKVAATITRINRRLVISEPKTERSRREVPLHPTIVTMLRKHRTAQKAERLAAGDQWNNIDNLVFTTELGGRVDPRKLLHVVKTAAKAAGVDRTNVHTLRHSAAVLWLESGTHIKAVADLLGHSSISITGDTYGHTSTPAARAAIDTLGAQLGL
jgi:integrase